MRQAFLALPFVLLIFGCSSFRVAYNQADWYLAREVNKYLCPTSEQRGALERVAERFLRWHRRHELPRYAKVFRRVARALDRPVKKELLLETFNQIDQARQRASRRLAPDLVAFGLRLGEAQARCLAALEEKCDILWSLLDAVEAACRRPSLSPHAMVREEEGATMVVLPERAVKLGGSGREILDACDGERSRDAVARLMRDRHPEIDGIVDDVHEFFDAMEKLGVLV